MRYARFASHQQSRHLHCSQPYLSFSTGFLLPALLFAIFAVIPTTAQNTSAPAGRNSNQAALAVDVSSHTVFAVDTVHNTVVALTERTGVRKTIEVGKAPISLALDPTLKRLYVVCAGIGAVQVISLADYTVTATIPTDRIPYAIAVDPGLHRIYVTNTFSSVVTEIDGAHNTARSLPLGSKDTALVDPLHHRVYFTSYEDSGVTELDEVSGAVRHLPAANHLWALAGNWQHDRLYGAVIDADSLVVVSLEAPLASPQQIALPSMPDSVLLGEDGRVFAASYQAGSVTLLRPALSNKANSLPVGSHPVSMAFDPLRHRLYVANLHGNSVTVIDTVTDAVQRTLPAGKSPNTLALDPVLGNVFTANYAGDPLTEVDAH